MPITPDPGTTPQRRQRIKRQFNSEKFLDALSVVYSELSWLRSSLPLDSQYGHELRQALDSLTDAEATVLEVAHELQIIGDK